MDTNKLFQYLGQCFAQANALTEENDRLKKELEKLRIDYDKLSQQEQLVQNVVKQYKSEIDRLTLQLEQQGNDTRGAGEISTQDS